MPESCVFLNWDQYGPTFKANLDLFVFDSDGSLVESSTSSHPPSAYPAESVCFDSLSEEATYEIEVRRASGSVSDLDVTLLSLNHDFDIWVVASSMIDPAVGSGALAVGAVQASRWNSLATATTAIRSW